MKVPILHDFDDKIDYKNIYKLNYNYYSLFSLKTGKISGKVTPDGLVEDLSVVQNFYFSEIYKTAKDLSSNSIRHLLMLLPYYPSEVEIYVVSLMMDKEVPGFFEKIKKYFSIIKISDSDNYNFYSVQECFSDFIKKLGEDFKKTNRFSGEIENPIEKYSGYLDERPILEPDKYQEDYIKKWYTLSQFPDIDYIEEVLHEFPGESIESFYESIKDLYIKVLENPSDYSPKTLKFMMSYKYKTFV